MERLENKIAVITGGASGIGCATALRFAREGAAVVVADINAPGASSVVAESGGRGLALAVDAGVEDDIRRMVSSTVDAFGRIDVLFNTC